jgi:hypothetical protein
MRKLMMFAGLGLLSSSLGCRHADTGCSSCGSGCGSGCSSGHHPCTTGVCDCDIPPLSPYTYPRGGGVAAAAAPGLTPVPAAATVAATDTPKDMPKGPDR